MTTETTPTETIKPIVSSLVRTINLVVTTAQIDAATNKELQKIGKTVKIHGFRKGKAPAAKIKQMYSNQAGWEAINDQVAEAFATQVTSEKLRVAGSPSIVPNEAHTVEGELGFIATFEVYPTIGAIDLSNAEIEQAQCAVTEADVTRTVDVLRQQRVTYITTDKAATKDDQVTIDFEGKIDNIAFAGGNATDYAFVLGQGRMLPEFETAIEGLKKEESTTFDLPFPDDYHGKDVAGKTAQFTVTVKDVAVPKLPELNKDFALSLGVVDGNVQKMVDDIKVNLEREITQRTKSITKNNVMGALLKSVSFDVPTTLVNNDIERLQHNAKEDLKARGIPVDDKMTLPVDIFKERAERRVRLGLLVAELVQVNNLQATPEQIKDKVSSIAQAYEKPQEFVRWYMSDRNRLAEIEAVSMEDNVVAWALSKVKVTTKDVPFEELMSQQQQG